MNNNCAYHLDESVWVLYFLSQLVLIYGFDTSIKGIWILAKITPAKDIS